MSMLDEHDDNGTALISDVALASQRELECDLDEAR
jgi:hypothetical protein